MLYAIVAVLVIILDQWVKYAVGGTIAMGTVEEFIPGILSLVNVHNDGAAFGFLSGGGARIYFIILTGVFTVAVIVALATNFVPTRLGRWSLALMTAGGISNCIDRVLSGFVQDMFMIELFDFPVFNVADIFITVFCFFFILSLFFGKRAVDEDEFEEDDEDEDRPAPPPKEKKTKAEKEKQPGRKTRQNKYEDEYERYKASRAARQQQAAQEEIQEAPQPQPAAEPVPAQQPVQPPVKEESAPADPFAEWERANAAAKPAPARPQAGRGQRSSPAVQEPKPQPASPQSEPAPAPKAAPKSEEEEFSLEDILNEFK